LDFGFPIVPEELRDNQNSSDPHRHANPPRPLGTLPPADKDHDQSAMEKEKAFSFWIGFFH
jgi:hypothetical protein